MRRHGTGRQDGYSNMTDIGDLTSHVESNPNDHDQRWHLAKKLYMAGEYRSALGHMLVLQTNWTPKVNVLRYLAATYYRLGRYDEAITELKTGIEEWPDEIPLREQLARVLEVSGRYEDAIAAWEGILDRNPNNSMAKRLLNKLQEAKPGKKEESKSADAQHNERAIGSTIGNACPNCGAQNSEEFDRCWKCHSPLGTYGMPDFTATPVAKSEPRRAPAFPIMHLVCGVAAAAVLGFGVYLSIKQFSAVRAMNEHPVTLCTVREIVDSALLSTRVAMGLVMLIVWPAVLWFGAILMQPGISARGPVLSGVLMAAAGYLSLWQAPDALILAFLGTVVLAAVPIVAVMRLRVASAVAVWLIQAAAVLCTALASAVALEGATLLKEFPDIVRYAKMHDGMQQYGGKPGRTTMASVYVPVKTSLQWETTGSTWLDGKATRADFEIAGDTPIPNLTAELKHPKDGTVFYEHAPAFPHKFTFDKVVPNVPFQFLITGQDNAKLDVNVQGLLKLRIGE